MFVNMLDRDHHAFPGLHNIVVADLILDLPEPLNGTLNRCAQNNGILKRADERPEDRAFLGPASILPRRGSIARRTARRRSGVDQVAVKPRVKVGMAMAKENLVIEPGIDGKLECDVVNLVHS
jgi:hypothetical protein